MRTGRTNFSPGACEHPSRGEDEHATALRGRPMHSTMFMLRRHVLLVSAVLAAPACLSGQALASVRLTIRDTMANAPVRRTYLWLADYRSVLGTPQGELRLDSIAPGRYRLQVGCSVARSLTPHILLSDTIALAPYENMRRTISTSAAGCDQRPYLSLRGTFRGLVQFGFEHSRFIACTSEGARVGLPPALADSTANITVELGERAGKEPTRWPPGSEREFYQEWFVEFTGTIEGPWRFGHLGGSEYQAVIDVVHRVRPSRPVDCDKESAG